MCSCSAQHRGIRCGGIGCYCHDDDLVTLVPLKFDGFVIGNAVISSDYQTITATIDSSGVGLEIRERLQSGLYDALSIKPNPIPAKPMFAADYIVCPIQGYHMAHINVKCPGRPDPSWETNGY